MGMPELESDKELLRDILSDREYTSYYTVAGEGRSWIGRAWDFIVRKLAGLLPDTAVPRSAADFLSYAVILAGLVLLGYLLVWIGRRIAFDKRLRRSVGLTEGELSLTCADYLRQAEAALSGGTPELREGVRSALLAFLFYADGRGWLQVAKWKANGEYAMELKAAGRPEAQSLFGEAARLFDEVWYGKRETQPEELERLCRSVSVLIAGAGEEEHHAYRR